MSRSPEKQENQSKVLWLTLGMLVACLGLRAAAIEGFVPMDWMNFSPMMTLAFAGALLLPRVLPTWSWIVLLLGVDFACRGTELFNYNGGRLEILACYLCYAIAAYIGKLLHGRVGILGGLVGAFACSVTFYLVSNSVSWLIEPYYAKTLAGWVQALTTGVPGPWPSTLAFFRNSLMADMAGVMLLFAVAHSEAVLRGYRLKRFALQKA